MQKQREPVYIKTVIDKDPALSRGVKDAIKGTAARSGRKQKRFADDPMRQLDKNAHKQTVGYRIREAREKLDMTQDDVAKLVGLVRTSVVQWESGRSTPSIPTITQLASVLQVRPAWLAFGETYEPIVKEPDPETMGYALVKERHYGATVADTSAGASWGLSTTWMRGELNMRAIDNVFIHCNSAAGKKHDYNDRLIIDGSDVRPSPPGEFLMWDGVGASLADVAVIPGQGRKATVRVTPDGGQSYEVELDRLQILGRVKGVCKKAG